MGVFGKIGSGFKWIGKKLLGLIRRDEILIAVRLVAGILPIPALYEIVKLVKFIDTTGKSGAEKFAWVLENLPDILEKYGVDIEDRSELNFIIELAVKVMKGKARVIDTDQ